MGVAPINAADLLSEVGTVLTVSNGIAHIQGLNVQVGEMVEFSGGLKGMALSAEKDIVGIAVLGDDRTISIGDVVKQVHQMMKVPVGDALLGRVVDASGSPIDGKGPIAAKDFRQVHLKAPGSIKKEPVSEPLLTGIKAIDALVPMARGLSAAIIGDRQTGKTGIAIDTILNQRAKSSLNDTEKIHCIYVSIGQKRSEVAQIVNVLQEHGAMHYTTVVTASVAETPALQYLAPFVGSALAEHFRDSGKHALVIYDDLSKHAHAYRQTSLRQTSLLRRSGLATMYNLDVYSRLMSRAAQMSNTMGGGSLTALPILETLAGDVSASMIDMLSFTDGQIFLETELFYRGFRPAINLGLSLTKLSRGVQSKAMAQVTAGLKLQLLQYREVAAFAQFSADLDADTLQLLTRGEKMMELLKQESFTPFAEEEIIACLYAGAYGYLDHVPTAHVNKIEAMYLASLRGTHPEILDAIKRNNRLDKQTEKALRQVIVDIVEDFHRRRLLSQADGDAQRLTGGKVLV